jgi:hypothetical protein
MAHRSDSREPAAGLCGLVLRTVVGLLAAASPDGAGRAAGAHPARSSGARSALWLRPSSWPQSLWAKGKARPCPTRGALVGVDPVVAVRGWEPGGARRRRCAGDGHRSRGTGVGGLQPDGGPAWVGVLFVWLVFVVVNGLGEERGWRGYALPLLRRRHGTLAASLLLLPVFGRAGPCHCPSCCRATATLASVGVPGFLLGLACGSILLAWLYESAASSFPDRRCVAWRLQPDCGHRRSGGGSDVGARRGWI